MKLGEVCLLTNDVVRLAGFYKELLGVDNGSDDPVHQFILSDEPTLTVYNDGTQKHGPNETMCLAFTVEDIDEAYEKVKGLGARVVAPPATQPWGARNMSFCDPDGNMVYLRQFPGKQDEA
ncbi:MAG: VOC family protein [Eubacteriales bacterium]|nr:VOC family protein [Eubacteriales bacterium]